MDNKLFGIDVSRSVEVQPDKEKETETVLKRKQHGKIAHKTPEAEPEVTDEDDFDIDKAEGQVLRRQEQTMFRDTDLHIVEEPDAEDFDKTR